MPEGRRAVPRQEQGGGTGRERREAHAGSVPQRRQEVGPVLQRLVGVTADLRPTRWDLP